VSTQIKTMVISDGSRSRIVGRCTCGQFPAYQNFTDVGFPLHELGCECGREVEGLSVDEVADSWQKIVGKKEEAV